MFKIIDIDNFSSGYKLGMQVGSLDYRIIFSSGYKLGMQVGSLAGIILTFMVSFIILQEKNYLIILFLFLMSRERVKKKYGKYVFKKVVKGNIKEVLSKTLIPKNIYT